MVQVTICNSEAADFRFGFIIEVHHLTATIYYGFVVFVVV